MLKLLKKLSISKIQFFFLAPVCIPTSYKVTLYTFILCMWIFYSLTLYLLEAFHSQSTGFWIHQHTRIWVRVFLSAIFVHLVKTFEEFRFQILHRNIRLQTINIRQMFACFLNPSTRFKIFSAKKKLSLLYINYVNSWTFCNLDVRLQFHLLISICFGFIPNKKKYFFMITFKIELEYIYGFRCKLN